MQTISFEASSSTHLEDYYVIKVDKYRILKIATILGANASGKSNVVKAFSMLRELMLYPCENKSSIIEYAKFALDEQCKSQDSVMVVNFICGSQKYRYEVHFNNHEVNYEILNKHPFGELRAHKVFERTTDSTSGVSAIKWGDKYKSVANTRALSVSLLQNRTVFGAFQTSNVDIPWMKEILDWLDDYFMPNVTPKEQHLTDYVTIQLFNKAIDKDMVCDQLRKADIGVSDLSIEREIVDLPPYLVDHILNDERAPEGLKKRMRTNPTNEKYVVRLVHNGKDIVVPFDFGDESAGTQRYYQLSGILMKLINESHFIAVDELECRLHPDLYIHFITTFLLNSKSSQMVFTTHMREFLADRDLFRDDCVWLTEKNDEGATDLYSIADFGSDVLRDTTSRYNMYKAGRLGAVPRLQS